MLEIKCINRNTGIILYQDYSDKTTPVSMTNVHNLEMVITCTNQPRRLYKTIQCYCSSLKVQRKDISH